jgi:hypothetical protein
MKRLLSVGALLLWTSVATATPSVFVSDESGFGWWLRKADARILGQSAGSVTTAELSAYIEETMPFSPYRVCFMEAVQADTFVGIDRATQAAIEATLPDVAWQVEGVTPDGRKVLGQSVIFEGCHPDEPRGAALLVTDPASGEILRWEPLGDRIREDGRSYPAWALFLSPSESDDLFSYSGCPECGARTSVYYDVTRRQIYTEYNGH